MKEPVDHILRPQLPWRSDAGITECGYDASKVKTLSRKEFLARLKDFGQRRTAMLTCMTCSNTATRWGTWPDDPRKALEREIQGECAWRRRDPGFRLQYELHAVAALIQNHQDEFAAAVSVTEQRREWNSKKTAASKQRASQYGGQ